MIALADLLPELSRIAAVDRPFRRQAAACRANHFALSEICQALPRKIFLFRFSEIHDCIRPSRFHMEGRLANRHKRWNGTRWTLRISPGVRYLRGRAKTRGPDLPTLRSSLSTKIDRRRRLSSPALQGERGISRKTVARGMSDDPAEPVVTAACFFCCRRAMGAACIRHSLRPLHRGRSR